MESIPMTNIKDSVTVKSREIETFHKKEIPKIDWGDNVTENFEGSLRIRKEVVKRVLDSWDTAKNNDFIMFIECLRDEFDVQVRSGRKNYHIVIPKEIIMKIPSPESYTRLRRKLNASGLFLPTSPNVIYARSKKEKAMREYVKREKMFEFKDRKQIQDTY